MSSIVVVVVVVVAAAAVAVAVAVAAVVKDFNEITAVRQHLLLVLFGVVAVEVSSGITVVPQLLELLFGAVAAVEGFSQGR